MRSSSPAINSASACASRPSKYLKLPPGPFCALSDLPSRSGLLATTAPAASRLVFVADNTNVLLRTGQQAHQLVLHSIGVLILIHVDVLEASLPFLARGRGFAQ